MSQASPPVILSVDDNPTNLELLFRVLGDAGFELLFAEDGESALLQARDAKPDLILLDVGMPGIDGFETCRRLKRIPETADTPVIFLTAYAETQNKVEGFSLGAADYITKPLQHEEVLVRVRTQLDIKRLQRELKERNTQLEAELRARRDAEEARRRVEGRIHEAQKLESLAALAQGAAQEFDHLLSSILTHVELATVESPARSPISAALALIDVTAHRASELARQMLAYAGTAALHRAPIALPALVAQMRPLLDVATGACEVEYALDLQTPDITGDARLLRQVVLNMVSNAFEALRQGQGTIRVTVRPCDESGLAAELSIRDTGTGMDESVRDRAFDPFFTTKLPGRGLGLAASLGIVRSHGGTIDFESHGDQGTTVIVRLPAHANQAPGVSAPSEATTAPVPH